MTPSEYFARNFWVGASFLRSTESACATRSASTASCGVTDYPHSEGPTPSAPWPCGPPSAAATRPSQRMRRGQRGLALRLRPRGPAPRRRPDRADGGRGGHAARRRGLPDGLDLQRLRPAPGAALLVSPAEAPPGTLRRAGPPRTPPSTTGPRPCGRVGAAGRVLAQRGRGGTDAPGDGTELVEVEPVDPGRGQPSRSAVSSTGTSAKSAGSFAAVFGQVPSGCG